LEAIDRKVAHDASVVAVISKGGTKRRRKGGPRRELRNISL
jgi:hypothetical protein